MSEQVQVCEGWWNLRDGRQVKVWRDTSNERRPWFGEHNGIRFSWMADGRYHAGTNSPADLVEYVGTLPQPAPEPAPEPQPAEIREGVWKMRGGNEIEVRAGSDFGDWPWRGEDSEGEIYWFRDGRFADSGAPSDCDLVTYLRPLPEPEPAPEPVKLSPGIWKTREGHEVEVRERDDNGPAHFRWVGLLSGVRESWRDDGTRSLRDEADRRDLVEYVGPLPQQTTTDTLAEIQEQIDRGEPWERLAVALQQQLTESLAERDRLQQAHQTMTEHARELLESAQQARDQRDLLAQQLVTKPSEEALQKQVAKQQIEINTLKDQLGDMTTDRETLRRQFAAMTADRDRVQAELAIAIESFQNERFQAQQAHAGCKRAEENLADMTAERDRLVLDVDALNQSNTLLDRTCRLLTQERGSAIEERDRARLHIDKLQAELRQAQIDLDAERETPAANCKAIVDAHLVGAQNGRQAAFEAVERWLEPLAGVDSEHAAAVLQALPGCIRKLAELEGVTW